MLDIEGLLGAVVAAVKAPAAFWDDSEVAAINEFPPHIHVPLVSHSYPSNFLFEHRTAFTSSVKGSLAPHDFASHPAAFTSRVKGGLHAANLFASRPTTRSKAAEATAFYGANGPTEPLIAFVKAEASDEFNSVNFGAKSALYPGSGYWCSSGRSTEDEVITWTGRLVGRRKVRGIKINWAYSPGEFKILTSPDGANFEETKCWAPKTSDQVSYEQDIMFDGLRNVKAVQIQMRGPQEWKYFGINDAVLVAGPAEPVLLVNGMKADEVLGEYCLSKKTFSDELDIIPCSAALQANDGRAIFKFNEEGQLEHLSSKLCLTGGGSPGGSNVFLDNCQDALSEGDGRSLWEVTGDGQFKLARSGSECLVHVLQKKDGKKVRKVILQACDQAGDSNDAQDKWFLVSAKTDFEGAPNPEEHEFLFGHKPPPIPGLEEESPEQAAAEGKGGEGHGEEGHGEEGKGAEGHGEEGKGGEAKAA